MLKELVILANRLDEKGLVKEAAILDGVAESLVRKVSTASGEWWGDPGAMSHEEHTALEETSGYRDYLQMEELKDELYREEELEEYEEETSANAIRISQYFVSGLGVFDENDADDLESLMVAELNLISNGEALQDIIDTLHGEELEKSYENDISEDSVRISKILVSGSGIFGIDPDTEENIGEKNEQNLAKILSLKENEEVLNIFTSFLMK